MSSSDEEVKFLRDLVWVHEAYQYAKERVVESQNEISFCRTAASMYQHRLGGSSFAERAAETANQRYAVLTRSGTFDKTPGHIV